MKRNVSVWVSSRQYIDGDINCNKFTSDGTVEITGNVCKLNYREDLGEGVISDCVITVLPESITISRSGGINNTLEIIPDRQVSSVYKTELGEFSLTVTGKRIKIKHSEKRTEITAYYYLDFGGTGNVLNKVSITAEYGDIINE